MTNPENSHVKVIKTEYVGADAAKKQLTPHQQELVEAIQSFSSWDDFEADVGMFRSCFYLHLEYSPAKNSGP